VVLTVCAALLLLSMAPAATSKSAIMPTFRLVLPGGPNPSEIRYFLSGEVGSVRPGASELSARFITAPPGMLVKDVPAPGNPPTRCEQLQILEVEGKVCLLPRGLVSCL